jgi:glutathione S-transferase
MARPTLVIGNKAYSSWSLRPWLLMRQAGIDFDEIRLPLHTDAWTAGIGRYSPSGKVPALIDGEIRVWDSLAICEYLAETHPEKALWPRDRRARATARAVSAEMHSGFRDLRSSMPMNVRRSLPDRARIPETLRDVARIKAIWKDCRARFGAQGDFLFGSFSIADAMYAPVASRFRTYAVELDSVCETYVDAIHSLPAMQRWIAEARAETEVIAQYET